MRGSRNAAPGAGCGLRRRLRPTPPGGFGARPCAGARGISRPLAERLAALLAPSLPVDGLVESLVSGVALLRRIDDHLEPRPHPLGRLLDFDGTVLREVEALLAASRAGSRARAGARSTILIDLLPALTAVLRAAPRTLPALRAFLPGPGTTPRGGGSPAGSGR